MSYSEPMRKPDAYARMKLEALQRSLLRSRTKRILVTVPGELRTSADVWPLNRIVDVTSFLDGDHIIVRQGPVSCLIRWSTPQNSWTIARKPVQIEIFKGK